jgi:hypothetical protein
MTALPTKAEVRLLAISPRCQEPDSRRSCAIASPMVIFRKVMRRQPVAAGGLSTHAYLRWQHLLHRPAELRHRIAHGGNAEGDAPAAGRRVALQMRDAIAPRP